MRKITFKGTINGKEFDNVQDYNAEMNSLFSAGETNITASSSTTVTEEPEEKKRKELEITDFLPFFYDQNDKYYLDKLVSDDAALNEKNLAYADRILSASYADLSEALESDSLTVEQALSLANIIKEIRSQIEVDSHENNNAVNELTEKITADTQRLNLLNNAKPVLAMMSDYYNDVFNKVRDFLLKF